MDQDKFDNWSFWKTATTSQLSNPWWNVLMLKWLVIKLFSFFQTIIICQRKTFFNFLSNISWLDTKWNGLTFTFFYRLIICSLIWNLFSIFQQGFSSSKQLRRSNLQIFCRIYLCPMQSLWSSNWRSETVGRESSVSQSS